MLDGVEMELERRFKTESGMMDGWIAKSYSRVCQLCGEDRGWKEIEMIDGSRQTSMIVVMGPGSKAFHSVKIQSVTV